MSSPTSIPSTPTPLSDEAISELHPTGLQPRVRPNFSRTVSSQLTASTSTTASFSSRPRKNKPRIYLALYARATSNFRHLINCDDAYHWGFLVASKSAGRSEPGTCYHLHHDLDTGFFYEQDDFQSSKNQTILVRVAIAKVINQDRLEHVLRQIAIPSRTSIPSSFTCLSWVRTAYLALIKDGKCLKGYVTKDDWKEIEETTRKYGKQKRQQRRFTDAEGPWDPENVPTWNFWENRQTTP